ncbi:hypothetical protein AAFC00_003542 [Neodothiora populina]|uniref:DUF1770-domain-containing protein n=1 Tax=Neodothiora populina TaxID=2781224 RepID=A0ABR3PET2_9PEZI
MSGEDILQQLAETIQTASINQNPSAEHDANPSTAASNKQPVQLDRSPDPSEISSDVEEDEIPVSVLRPVPRRNKLPPLPDLRFEQSYLASIQNAESWQRVAWITFRDQVFMPLTQGVVWTLALAGWRHWNQTAQFSGQTVGARIRRWWYKTNNWKIPPRSRLRDERLAGNIKEYYQAEFSNAGAD